MPFCVRNVHPLAKIKLQKLPTHVKFLQGVLQNGVFRCWKYITSGVQNGQKGNMPDIIHEHHVINTWN